MSDLPRALLDRYPLVSNQVNTNQIEVILAKLESCLDRNVSGAIVEFGCYIGTTSLFIRRLLDSRSDTRPFHVYDSFEGLPEKTTYDNSRAGEQFQAGELAVSKKQFMQQFKKAGLWPPLIHKKWFNDLTATDVPDKIAFAFLDGDFYESIRDSLRLVVPRMQPGGTIVIDDYVREALPGAAKAVHEYFAESQIRVTHNVGIIKV